MGRVNLSMKRMCGFEMKNNGLWALSLAILMHLGKLKDTLEILKHIRHVYYHWKQRKVDFLHHSSQFFYLLSF